MSDNKELVELYKKNREYVEIMLNKEKEIKGMVSIITAENEQDKNTIPNHIPPSRMKLLHEDEVEGDWLDEVNKVIEETKHKMVAISIVNEISLDEQGKLTPDTNCRGVLIAVYDNKGHKITNCFHLKEKNDGKEPGIFLGDAIGDRVTKLGEGNEVMSWVDQIFLEESK